MRFTNLSGHSSLDTMPNGFFLKLTDREDHAHGAAVGAKSTLCFWKGILRYVFNSSIETNPRQHFPSNGKKWMPR